MTLFEWLLVGHLIGDWVFQNDWMVRHKQRGLLNRAIHIHCLIYTLTLSLILLIAKPELSIQRMGLFIMIVYVTHWLIDAAGAAGHWIRLFRQTDALFMRIAVDQVFHVVVLALLIELIAY